ncbi:MAG: hypothetical protein ABIV63_11150 [Caldimonas sp.]
MATVGERREDQLDEDLLKAEEITRRQYATAVDIASQSGSAEPTLVAGVMTALAINAALIQARRRGN